MSISQLVRTMTVCAVAAATAVSLSAASTIRDPAPLREGPAGPPALLPDGRVARPPAVPVAPAAAGCPAAPYGARFYAPGSGKTVALTFDDGPGRTTPQVLSILRTYRVPATFFNLGENEAARRSLVQDEAKEGYPLGNHSWDHPNMATLSTARQAAEMDRTSAEQRSIVRTVPCVFRPPYGDYNATTLRLAQRRDMAVWLWSVDTEDWKAEGSSSSYWVNRIIRLAEQEGGALRHPVVLMHNQPIGNPATVRALPTIINFFRGHGYRFAVL
jgi:peptidoglycan/xylan/chitin deacetylase (PgdA/CDA1 family)